MNTGPFAVPKGTTVSVRNSSTVLIVRKTRSTETLLLRKGELGSSVGPESGLFGDEDALEFTSGWEVLMAQNEVVNWLRSTPEKIVTMRYPGEFKFAGGNVEEGESTLDAAKRELYEELLNPCQITLPKNAVFRPFAVKQTRPIRGRSNMMFNYVLFADENPWLNQLPVSRINEALAQRRFAFAKSLKNGSFWSLPVEEKEKLSPEVRQVAWINLRDACKYMLSSMNKKVIYVNEFQKAAFEKHGIKRRDPMFITGATLFELEGFPTEKSLIKYSRTANMDALAKAEQWCFSGFTQTDLDNAFKHRLRNEAKVNPSFKTLAQIRKLKAERLKDEASNL